MGGLPPVFIEFLGKASGFHAVAKGVTSAIQGLSKEGATNLERLSAVSQGAFLGIGTAAVGAAVKTVHMAADFETQMTRVRTGAGEMAGNMKLVSDGVLQMAGQVGKSTAELTTGLYTVESAGYHGSDALNVLKVSAMGAKVGAAELGPVTDAVTTALNAYSLKATDATGVMNALVATEGQGKTTMEALAGSMSSILPVASAAHVGLNEVLGAMATMTAQGTSADVAATYLRQTIGQLSNPSAKAAQEMRGLGLSSIQVSQNLGKNGLAATLTELTDAIQSKMGPAGTVIIETLKKASSNTNEYQKALANLKPAEQTQIAALADMVGGTKSMQAALQLTGAHMQTFKDNTKVIADHVKAGGNAVEGWADVQKTFNQRMAEAKATVESVGIQIGQKLLPYAEKMIGVFTTSIQWMEKHKGVAIALGAAIGTLLVGGLVAATVAMWGFTAAALGNPVVWIIVGVMALVAAIVELVMHWREVWNWVKTETPTVARVFSEVWRGALSLFHSVFDGAMRAVHAVAKWFDDNVLKWLQSRAGELVSWWKGHTKELSEAWNLVWQIIRDTAVAVWAILKDGFMGVVAILSDAWKILLAAIEFVWTNIKNVVTLGIHLVMNIISVVLDIITGHWGKAWSDALHLVNQAFWDIVHFIGGLVSSFGNLLWDAGSALIHGLVSGIKSAGHMVWDALKGIGNDALDAFKSMFGIKSPSRVMRDEVGKWIPHGLADGIDHHAGVAKDAMTRLGDSTRAGFGGVGSVEPAFAGGGSTGSSGSPYAGNVTNINVTVTGSVVAERDLTSKIQQVMLQNGSRNSQTYQPFKR